MNRFARNVVAMFMAAENTDYLANVIRHKYAGEVAARYFIERDFKRVQYEFASVIGRRWCSADPMEGVRIIDVVESSNMEFLDMVDDKMGADGGSSVAIQYSVGESGLRFNEIGDKRAANDILDCWKDNPKRQIQWREDPQCCNGAGGGMSSGIIPTNEGFSCGPPTEKVGMSYCDTRGSGQNSFYDVYFGSEFNTTLNNDTCDYLKTGFGEATRASDERLLARRTREMGDVSATNPNGIRYYEKSLYTRPYDRAVNETLRGTQFDYKLSGYDMCSMNTRLDNKIKLYDFSDERLDLNPKFDWYI